MKPLDRELATLRGLSGCRGDDDRIAEAEAELARLRKIEDAAELACGMLADCESAKQARPLADWHEEVGVVLWWRLPVDEPPYCGSPLDDDWPGYHTHWTPLIVPDEPADKHQ